MQAAPAESASYGESSSIYGIHFQAPIGGRLRTGGEENMADMGTRGWVMFFGYVCFREGLSNIIPTDFRPWADAGYGVIVRVDSCAGSVPHEADYAAWASSVAGYVQSTSGAHIWIIANETNLPAEFPSYDGHTEPVTPQQYATVFKMVRASIKSLPGHGNDVVVTQAVAPTAPIARSFSYHRDLLLAIGEGNVDGLALHAYTDNHNPSEIAKRFRREYQGFLRATPDWARSLPVWITETLPVGGGWKDTNNGWVKTMYAEVDAWNRTPGTQKIRGAMMFIWDPVALPNADFHSKPQVIQDWREAMINDYRWTGYAPPGREPPEPGELMMHWEKHTLCCHDLGEASVVKSRGADANRVSWP
jgi:hypothetical protein